MPFQFRPDGTYVKNLSLTRRIMPFIMKGRNESIVFFEQKIPVDNAWDFLASFREKTNQKASIFHLLLWAGGQILNEHPRLNRFVAGRRIFQRHGIWVCFSAKKKMDDTGPVIAIKRKIDPNLDFQSLVKTLTHTIAEEKSDKLSHTDKELSLIFKLPAFIISPMARLLMKLDHFGLLPDIFIKDDPMFASIMVANLGSFGLDAAYHHLFEYGNIPIFITIGKKHKEVVVDDSGEIRAVSMITLKFSFDERIADGFYCLRALGMFNDILSNPEKFITI
ncbi:MAG: 2-oxo acid dehydrogenase subunit E2 [Candidatus Marinimicrobia bacterium]|nr:2-oxo acid dehydrogenase subunit E2 [Candidatus Neomarinimicrobiota bacterium]